MPFNQELPTWLKVGTKPPSNKLNTDGWLPGDKPPADWLNWLSNRSHEVLKELQQNAIHKEEKGIPNGIALLGIDGKVPDVNLPSTEARKAFPSLGAWSVSGSYMNGYLKDSAGMVHVWFRLSGYPSGLSTSTIAQLPVGYRPGQNMTFFAFCTDGATPRVARGTLFASGNFSFDEAAAAGQVLNVAYFTFKAEN